MLRLFFLLCLVFLNDVGCQLTRSDSEFTETKDTDTSDDTRYESDTDVDAEFGTIKEEPNDSFATLESLDIVAELNHTGHVFIDGTIVTMNKTFSSPIVNQSYSVRGAHYDTSFIQIKNAQLNDFSAFAIFESGIEFTFANISITDDDSGLWSFFITDPFTRGILNIQSVYFYDIESNVQIFGIYGSDSDLADSITFTDVYFSVCVPECCVLLLANINT